MATGRGLADLRGAAAQYRQSFPHDNPEYLFTGAMMHLQAGESEPARQMLEQARALLEDQLAEGPTIDSGLLLDVLLLLGDGERAERALAEVQVARPDTVGPALRRPVLAELTLARSTKDAQRAADAAARLHALARGQRSSYTESGPATLWDLYEQALIVQAEITGSAPPELREI